MVSPPAVLIRSVCAMLILHCNRRSPMACALFLSILSGRCDLPAGRHVINLIFPPRKEHPVANRAFPVKVRRKIRLLTILLVEPSLIPAVACSGIVGGLAFPARTAPPLAIRLTLNPADPAPLLHPGHLQCFRVSLAGGRSGTSTVLGSRPAARSCPIRDPYRILRRVAQRAIRHPQHRPSAPISAPMAWQILHS